MKRIRRTIAGLLVASLGGLAPDATAQADANLEAALSWNKKGVDLLEKDKDHEGAIDCFHKALQLKSGDPIIRKNLAAAYSQQGQARRKARQFEAAAGSFRAAAELAPEESRYPFFAAFSYFEANKMDDAAREARQCVKAFPAEIDAYHLLGEILFGQGHCEEAIAQLEKGLAELAKQEERASKEAAIEGKPPEPAAEKEARGKRKAAMGNLLEKARTDFHAGACEQSFTSAHFDFHFDSQRADLVKNDASIAQVFEDAYAFVGDRFGVYPEKRFQVIFYDPKAFSENTRADEWVGGVFDGKIRIPVRDYSKEKARMRQVIFHEYTHALLYSVTNRCPTWLNEGLAQVEESLDLAAAEKRLAQSLDAFLAPAALHGSFLGLNKEQAVVAYDMSLSLTRALLDEAGYAGVMSYLRGLRDPQKKESDMFREAFGRSFEEWVEGWKLRFGE